MDDATEQHIAHCSSCDCKMDISVMEPYTNVVCPDCGHHTRVKCELGPYLLIGRHAVGGMSMVFKARDVTLDREVAIKILNEDYSHDEQRMKQFEREAMITAAISHPHVVRVFTVGKAYGHFYIAMEMVPGENLEQRISRVDAIGEGEMLPIAAEIISGLRAAKQAGLIHRDMKPGNILFDSMGHVKIVDFGLALVTQGGTAKAEEIWATPYYVPPEALDGEEEDFRSDMYALGATLYHALSGQPPLSDDSKSTRAVRKAKESIVPLSELAPWLKPETCYLVDKAMALRPKDRFSSYAEMEDMWNLACQAIKGTGAAEPIHSRERAQRRVKGESGMMSLVIIGFVALLLVGTAVGIFLNKGKSSDSDSDGDTISDTTMNHPDGYSPEVAARIGKQFRLSHKLLGEKKYDEAKVVFTRLMHDKQLTEPAASWAGVEAVIATWLGGNSGDARTAIGELQKHMQSRGVSNTSAVGELVDKLVNLGVVRQAEVGNDTMAVPYLMAVALKNWEIGAWDAAVPMLQKVQKRNLPNGSPLKVYGDIAGRYLSDYQTLKPIEEMSAPTDLDSARERLLTLQGALKTLKTRGRARFHVRVWQLRLHHQIKNLRSQVKDSGGEVAKSPSYAAKLPKFRELVAKAKFAEASDLLQDVIFEPHQRDERDAWVYLTDSAGAFLGGLEEVIPQAGVDMKIDAVDGKVYRRIVGGKDGGLQLLGDAGEVFVPWAEIKSESVLAIHQKAFRQTLTTLEGQLRTEQAICYAWLSGMEEKAMLAAGRLSDDNRNFRKRWQNTMRAHHQKP